MTELDTIVEINGSDVFRLGENGPKISSLDDFMDPLGNAAYQGATWIEIPVARLNPAFFDLRTKLAGEILQKLVNYNLKCAIIGDISAHLSKSNALRDFVYESNQGAHVHFYTEQQQFETVLNR